MKLRNYFLTAVFFSVGIASAFAEEAVDEDTFRETTYTFDNSIAGGGLNAYSLSFSKTAGNTPDDSTMFERDGATDTGSGRNDYSTDYKNDGISSTYHEDSASTAPDENKSLRVYDLSTSFYDAVTEEIGFTAHGDVKNPLVFSDVMVQAPNKSQLPNQETFSLLSFDKRMFTSAHNWGQILSGGYYYEGDEEENAFLLFSSMITIPFACLSITFGVGVLLIMYTSTGSKTNV